MNKYIPSLAMISQNAIATAIGLIAFALIVSQSPALKSLVRDYNLPNQK